MGDAASDYAAIAAKLVPGSADYQLASGCAANPSAPACASALAAALSTPYLNATDYANTVRSIAAGGGPVPLTATSFTGAPAGTIPSAGQTVVSRVMDQGSAPPAPVTVSPIMATPNIQPVQMMQPVGGVPPIAIAPSNPSSQLSLQNLGGTAFFTYGWLRTASFLGIPAWIWAIGGVAGVYFLFAGGKKHGRY